MENSSTSLWAQFLEGLKKFGINIPMDSFKAASGLQIADWQLVDYSGFLPQYKGQYNYQNLFSVADPMPDYRNFDYTPGNNFFDQYASYVNSIKVIPNDQTLRVGKDNLNYYKMGTPPQTWPGYTIKPDLYDWWLASSTSTETQAKFQFRVKLDSDGKEISDEGTDGTEAIPDFIRIKSETLNSPTGENSANSSNNNSSVTTPKKLNYSEVLFEFKAKNVQLFTVTPEAWFNKVMISGYYDKIDPNSALFNKALFGEYGVINLRVVAVLVIYKRTLVITANSQQQLENIHAPNLLENTSNSISIGGFNFLGGDATSFSTYSSSTDYSYVYTDNTDAPIIIGYKIDNLRTYV